MNVPRPRALVVGATGFVGGHALAALQRAGTWDVIAACRRPEALLPDFSGEIRAGDLRDPTYLAKLFQGVDVVCLAAAWSSLYGHARESKSLFLDPMLAALSAAADAGVARIVLTSAIDVRNINTAMQPAIRKDIRRVWPHLANLRTLEQAAERLSSARCQTIVLRCGFFTGEGVPMGLLPTMLPRLRRRLVPLIDGGRARMRLVDGADLGRAFAAATTAPGLGMHEVFDIVGRGSATFRDLYTLLRAEFGYPFPAFCVSYPTAFRFAHAAELLSRVTPWDPLITRSIIFLSEPFEARPAHRLGFAPQVDWLDSVRSEVEALHRTGHRGRLTSARLPHTPPQVVQGRS